MLASLFEGQTILFEAGFDGTENELSCAGGQVLTFQSSSKSFD